ncbi:MAG: hypothetical protein HY897_08140 [Deltaproteobacteria bacterium]|nr:hypothetical protein [Deltaproteobacteria bacterium]
MEERPAQQGTSEALRQAIFIAAAFAVATLGYYSWKFIFFRADWRAAAAAIQAEYKPGDAVVMFPSFLRDEVFNFKGMAAVAPKEDSYVNFHGFSRLWAAINTKYTPGNSDRLPLKNDVRVEKEIKRGSVVIRLYPLPSFNATQVFKAGKVAVYGISDAKRELCEKRANGTFKCGHETWQFVGAHKVDIAGQGAECIWAHPMSKKQIEIEFPAPAVSKLHVYSAFADTGSGGGYVPPVRFGLYQGGKAIKEYVHPQRSGWTKHVVTSKLDPELPLVAKVTTDQEGRQHWCFNIEAE